MPLIQATRTLRHGCGQDNHIPALAALFGCSLAMVLIVRFGVWRYGPCSCALLEPEYGWIGMTMDALCKQNERRAAFGVHGDAAVGGVAAVIFDMDGVLVDSEPLIRAAAIAMFRERGVVVEEDDFTPFVGAGENRYIGGVAEQYGVVLDLVAAKARTYAIYLELVPTQLRMFPGADDFVLCCKAAGLQVAVASSADRIKIDANLKAIGLPPACWGAVVSGEDLVHLKPAPDIFLEAARRLSVPAAACVVIEDAINGVQAAKAAQMRCVAVATSFTAVELKAADCVKPDIASITLRDIGGRSV